MKKVLLTIMMALCVLCFTGCIRFNTTVKVKSNGKADVSMLYAMQSVDGSDTDQSDMEKSYDELKSEGWEVESYNEDDYIGFICTKKNMDFNEFSDQMGDTEQTNGLMDSSSCKVTKKGFKYSFDWNLGGDEETADSSEYVNSLKSSGGYMTFTLKVPTKAISSNATTVSDGGKTLEWDLLALKPGEGIHAEFSLINWPLVIGGILAVVGIVICVIALVISNNKKKAVDSYPRPVSRPMDQFGNDDQYGMNQYGAPQQNQYAAPQQPEQNQYAAPQQNQYAAPQQPEQSQYAAPQQNQYAAPQQPEQSQYVAPQQPEQNQYAAPQQNQYAAPQQPEQNQYTAPQQPEQSQYVAPQQPEQNQYAAPQQPEQSQYVVPQQPEQNQYAAPEQYAQDTPQQADDDFDDTYQPYH